MEDKNKNIENALDILYSQKMGKEVDNTLFEEEKNNNSNGLEKTENVEDKIDAVEDLEVEKVREASIFPEELQNQELEKRYIGLLLNEIKAISMYYFKYEDCYFTDEQLLNIYKKNNFYRWRKICSKRS